MRDGVLYFLVGGFTAGILLRSFVDFGIEFSLLPILIAFSFLAFWRIERGIVGAFTPPPPEGGGGVGAFLLLAVFLFSAGIGMLRYDFADVRARNAMLDESAGQEVTVRGLVVEEPDTRETNARLIVRISELVLQGASASTSAKVLISTDTVPSYRYGDFVEAQGNLRRPKNFTDEVTGREVEYAAYLGKDGIRLEMFRPKIEILSRGGGNAVKRVLFSVKSALLENIAERIPEPHSALLGGLLVGAKQSLGQNLLDEFRRTGVIHMVVLSGYNLTIVADFVTSVFSFLPRSAANMLGGTGIILFAIMTGASATVVRASIMALLVILARSAARRYDITRALILAGFFMLLHNPKILVFDVSFQLSFLATVGLIYVSPVILPRVHFITERFKFREIVVATLATQIFVLPFLLYKTGILSLVALPVNLLVLAVVPAVMFLGFFAGLAGFLSAIVAVPFAFGAFSVLAYILSVVGLFANLPFASVAVSEFPLFAALSCYALYAIFLFRFKQMGRG